MPASAPLTVVGSPWGDQPAELDPTGADAGFHAPLVTEPNDEEGSSLLPYPSFGAPNHLGTTYKVDGLRVSLDYFMMALDNRFHGPLGMAEYIAKASAPRLRDYEVSSFNGRLNKYFGLNQNRAETEALETGNTLIRNFVFNDYSSLVVTLLPQNPGQTTTPTPNPNCITNAVAGATGLARSFGNVGPSGSIGHDGVHVLATAGSTVRTLAALTGKVIDTHNGGDGTKIVDVLLNNGNIAIYKDLIPSSVRLEKGQRLSVGSVIGRVGKGTDYPGLHFALLKGGMKEHDYYRGLTSRAARGDSNARLDIKAGMFINPLGPNSPVNCPGVPVNNAGVAPHP